MIIAIAQIILGIALMFALARLIKGPLVLDRVMALDGVAICIIGFLVIQSIDWHSPFFIDLVLVFSLLNFVGVVAYVIYLGRLTSKKESS